eukprot:CAMPEP_0172700900 /NCGR_PEP_ID=MMETSP1074-20121228/31236_1 /TAXON_ID=2916 /ORGANISM="Ceratium fusus, Strain PA161109" /LENGTH=542 /DNA_ID=CAMNT_0013522361 /DNA_START=155 /DNA_END=1780 /DNA_ORIENTATION=-
MSEWSCKADNSKGSNTGPGVPCYAALPSRDVGDLASPSSQMCMRLLRPTVIASATLVMLLCVLASLRASSEDQLQQPSAVTDLLQEFSFNPLGTGVDMLQKLGGHEIFHFQCPPPGLSSMVDQLVKMGNGSKASKVDACCEVYSRLQWPYFFDECRNSSSSCGTCTKATNASTLSRHSSISVAFVSWAANVAVYGKVARPVTSRVSAFLKAKLLGQHVTHGALKGKEMHGNVRNGLVSHERNLCPLIQDWDAYMLNADDHNLHARVYKSLSAKLAVVVFRGTNPMSAANWQVDVDLKTAQLDLGSGVVALVHEGFFNAAREVMPQVRKWVEGYLFGIVGSVPKDWKLVFTGHSLGGALALMVSTLAELHDWKRKPDVTITFGAPRIADKTLDSWWRSRGLCSRLLRVNVYNDVIHWTPFLTTWKWMEMLRDFISCLSDKEACIRRGPMKPQIQLSDRWAHICGEDSEVLIPGAVRGVNELFVDFSALGGVLAHLLPQCLYGYGHGMAFGGLLARDAYCGKSAGAEICEAWAAAIPQSADDDW